MSHRTHHHSGSHHSHHSSTPHSSSHHSTSHGTHKKASSFSKVFRWQSDPPGGPQPVSVAVVGSFNDWHKTPLQFDRANGIWQATLHDIPGNRTHSYMLLVNGKPASDKNSDGLAVPHTDQEKHYALTTARGPRVFMLFAQTK
jgi:1,4-alpha-glucan branching enzyme